MEAPKCKICGERHYGICPTNARAVKLDMEERDNSAGSARVSVSKPTAKFDRNEYQRKYMREWRAKRTAELHRLREQVK